MSFVVRGSWVGLLNLLKMQNHPVSLNWLSASVDLMLPKMKSNAASKVMTHPEKLRCGPILSKLLFASCLAVINSVPIALFPAPEAQSKADLLIISLRKFDFSQIRVVKKSPSLAKPLIAIITSMAMAEPPLLLGYLT